MEDKSNDIKIINELNENVKNIINKLEEIINFSQSEIEKLSSEGFNSKEAEIVSQEISMLSSITVNSLNAYSDVKRYRNLRAKTKCPCCKHKLGLGD